MARVVRITADIEARTGKLQKGLKRARVQTKGFVKSMLAMPGPLKAIAAAAAATLGARAIGGMIKEQFVLVDALAKTSDMLGIQTEALAGLQFAANITGVSTEGMNKALGKMLKTISDADVGLSTAKRAFDELGLSVSEIKQLDAEQQFAVIADAINGVGNQADKTRIAMDIFGRSGGALLNTLALGSEGLADFRKQAEQLGIAISRTDAAKIESANDAYAGMKEAIGGVFRSLAVQLAPILEAIFDAITNMLVQAGDWSMIWETAIDAVVFGISIWLTRIDLVTRQIRFLIAAGIEIGKFLIPVFVQVGKSIAEVARLVIDDVKAIIKSVTDVINRFLGDAMSLAERLGLGSLLESIGDFSFGGQDLETTMKNIASSFNDIVLNSETFGSKFTDMIGGFRDASQEAAEAVGNKGTEEVEKVAEAVEKALSPRSLRAGTAEAFSSFLAARRAQQGIGRDPAKENLKDNTRRDDLLADIAVSVKGGTGLKVATI